MTEDGARWAAMHPRPASGYTPEREGVDSTRLRARAVKPLVHGTARRSAPPDSAFLILESRQPPDRLRRGMGRRSVSARGVPSSRTKIARRLGTRDAGPDGWMDGYIVSALATHHPPVHCLEEPNRRTRTSPSHSAGCVHLLEHRVRRREAHRHRPTVEVRLGSARR
jgi:hypothetical protein